jgi:hypothetical protein
LSRANRPPGRDLDELFEALQEHGNRAEFLRDVDKVREAFRVRARDRPTSDLRLVGTELAKSRSELPSTTSRSGSIAVSASYRDLSPIDSTQRRVMEEREDMQERRASQDRRGLVERVSIYKGRDEDDGRATGEGRPRDEDDRRARDERRRRGEDDRRERDERRRRDEDDGRPTDERRPRDEDDRSLSRMADRRPDSDRRLTNDTGASSIGLGQLGASAIGLGLFGRSLQRRDTNEAGRTRVVDQHGQMLSVPEDAETPMSEIRETPGEAEELGPRKCF